MFRVEPTLLLLHILDQSFADTTLTPPPQKKNKKIKKRGFRLQTDPAGGGGRRQEDAEFTQGFSCRLRSLLTQEPEVPEVLLRPGLGVEDEAVLECNSFLSIRVIKKLGCYQAWVVTSSESIFFSRKSASFESKSAKKKRLPNLSTFLLHFWLFQGWFTF